MSKQRSLGTKKQKRRIKPKLKTRNLFLFPCGCYWCTGSFDKYYRNRKLKEYQLKELREVA